MKHMVKVTVLDKKCYPELQEAYCMNPKAGPCSCYNVGDEFLFRRDGDKDDFWHLGLGTLVKTTADPNTVAGLPCRSARRPGTPSAATFMPGCKVFPLCGAG